jgi:hypothetical protein
VNLRQVAADFNLMRELIKSLCNQDGTRRYDLDNDYPSPQDSKAKMLQGHQLDLDYVAVHMTTQFRNIWHGCCNGTELADQQWPLPCAKQATTETIVH